MNSENENENEKKKYFHQFHNYVLYIQDRIIQRKVKITVPVTVITNSGPVDPWDYQVYISA